MFPHRIDNKILHTPNWPQSYTPSSVATCTQQTIIIPKNYALKLFIMSVDTDIDDKLQCEAGQTDYLQVKSKSSRSKTLKFLK